jgi:hypothetical protein
MAVLVFIMLLAGGCKGWFGWGRRAAGTGPENATNQAQDQEGMAARRARDLAGVDRAATSQELKQFLSGDPVVAKAALAKLARMGDDTSIALICRAFSDAPRQTGTGAHGGVKALALEALAASGRPQAREFVEKTVDRFLQEGPAVETYAHIYDPQYFQVLQAGIRALGSFDDPAIDAKLQKVAGDESRFYSVRESAYRMSLIREMRRNGLSAQAQRAAWLMGKIEAGGVAVETWWKGDKPGSKTQPAARESAVESLMLEQGWEARAALESCLSGDENRDRRLAAARVLAMLTVQHLSGLMPGDATAEDKKALLSIMDSLLRMPGDSQASKTVSGIMSVVNKGAAALEDADINARCRAIQPKLRPAGAWSGDAPGRESLGVRLPADAKFVAEYSTRSETPYGMFVRAGYVSNQKPREVVQFFEQETGSKALESAAERQNQNMNQGTTGRFFIKFGQQPQELAGMEGLVDLGIIVLDFPNGFEQKRFGETIVKANTVFYVSVIGPRRRE